MASIDGELSDASSRSIAAAVREELARRRISRQFLADQARISISTLEKALAGRRPFTLATTIRLEQALGLKLRREDEPVRPAPARGGFAPDSLGSYTRPSVAWIEGGYLTLRPSFGDPHGIYAYRTEIAWDEDASCLAFRESERLDSGFTQFGTVSVPNQSGHFYLVTNRHGQYRMIVLGRPTVGGAMYGILTSLQAGRGSHLTPVTAPVALVPLRDGPAPAFGRIERGDAHWPVYRQHLAKVADNAFGIFLKPPD